MKTFKNEKTREVASLKAGRKNPRRITDARRDALKASILEFGDLSGVIRNVRSDELVGANQRVSIFREVGGEVVITERLKKPDKRGTVARGHVLVDGEKFSYREENWPLPRQRAANLAANKHGGEFIDEEVKEILAALSDEDRALAGFDSTELEALLGEAAAELEPVTACHAPAAEAKDDKEIKTKTRRLTCVMIEDNGDVYMATGIPSHGYERLRPGIEACRLRLRSRHNQTRGLLDMAGKGNLARRYRKPSQIYPVMSRQSESIARIRADRRAAGQCPDCGGTGPGRCANCKAKHAERMKRYMQKVRAQK